MNETRILEVYDAYRGKAISVILDADDYDRFCVYKWKIDRSGYVRRNKWYKDENGKSHTKTLLLHRCVLGVEWNLANGMCVDHINGDKLDNRKANLRIVTYATNSANRHAILTSTGVLNVSQQEGTVKYIARVTRHGKCTYLGSFDTTAEAYNAVQEYIKTGIVTLKKPVRRVAQKTLNGETIAVYRSCSEASKHTGVCSNNINQVANHDPKRSQAGGYVWEYV